MRQRIKPQPSPAPALCRNRRTKPPPNCFSVSRPTHHFRIRSQAGKDGAKDHQAAERQGLDRQPHRAGPRLDGPRKEENVFPEPSKRLVLGCVNLTCRITQPIKCIFELMSKTSKTTLSPTPLFSLQSMMTRRVPVHQIISEHDQSRSYQPSNTGIAAYYQAEQTAGLAVCPPPLHRVNSSHHVHGESPAEEVRPQLTVL